MSNDCQYTMDVDSPISSASANLKRCNSAPMINELNTTMSTATSTTSTASRDSFAFNVFSREQPRTRRFSASFSPLLQSPLIAATGNGSRVSSGTSSGSDSPPDPSSPPPTPPPPRGLAPRVTQLRQEGRLLVDVAGVRVREAAHERELNSAMQISRSWEDLTLLTPSPSSNSASPPNTTSAGTTFSPGHPLHPPSSTPPHMPLSPSSAPGASSALTIQPRVGVEGSGGKARGLLDPLHVHLPPSLLCGSLFSASSPFSHLSLSSSSPSSTPPPPPSASCCPPLASPSSSSFPSPTRPGFSGRQCFSPGSHAMASPSPTRKAFATRRSLSPIAMRPSSLGPMKRKFELGEASEERSSPLGGNAPVAMVGVAGGSWEHHLYPPAKRANLGLLVANTNARVFPSSAGSGDTSDVRDDSSIGFAFRPVGSVTAESTPGEMASVSREDSVSKVVAMELGGGGNSADLGESLGQQPCREGERVTDLMEMEKDSNAQPADESMTTETLKTSVREMSEGGRRDEEGSVGSR
ncbi:uncharacterized protein [Hetaerina americana]|uniref:uncharacterized protein n=1 Tax=Hetaerina americana TaxID=62018 RepID=UPI003A7F4E88